MVRKKTPHIIRMIERRLQKSPFSLIIGVCLFVLLLVASLIYLDQDKRKELEVREPISVEKAKPVAFDHQFQPVSLPIKTPEGHTLYGLGTIDDMAVSSVGDTLVSMSNYGLFVWELEENTGTPTLWLPKFYKHTPAIAFSLDGNYFALGSHTGELYLWKTETWKPLHKFTAHQLHQIQAIAFSPDGKSLLTGSHAGRAKLWDFINVEVKKTFNFRQPIEDLSFTPDGKMILGVLDRYKAKLFRVETAEMVDDFSDIGSISAGVLDTKNVYLAKFDRQKKNFDILRIGQKDLSISTDAYAIYSGHSRETLQMALSPETNRLLSGSMEGTAKLWDIEKGEVLHTFGEIDPKMVGTSRYSKATTPFVFFADQGKTAVIGEPNTGKIEL